jgi:hypothetical protein
MIVGGLGTFLLALVAWRYLDTARVSKVFRFCPFFIWPEILRENAPLRLLIGMFSIGFDTCSPKEQRVRLILVKIVQSLTFC